MKKLEFTGQMFEDVSISFTVNEEAATRAQFIFDEWLKGATVVYAEGDNQPWHNVSFQGATHKALVIGIEPIKPKCEKHEPEIELGENGIKVQWKAPLEKFDQFIFVKIKCKNCGVELNPEWKEKTV